MISGSTPPDSNPLPHSAQPSYRSGAVARMASMPVSTLRIWEQRYQAVSPSTAPSGHRLYTAADVERVALLRRLTGQGHAIGSVAGLGTEQLRELLIAQKSSHAQVGAGMQPRTKRMNMVVIGRAMARRLNRAAISQRLTNLPRVVAVFDSLSEAEAAAAGPSRQVVDLLLWQTGGLQVDDLAALQLAVGAWQPGGVAVAYRFASAAARDALKTTGANLAKEPADDAALVAWLASLQRAVDAGNDAAGNTTSSHADAAWSLAAMGLADQAAPARRYDDAALTEFAGLSSSIACECPSHVAELLIQISSFESYSADCTHRSPADAQLHASLQKIAGAARVLFESALERVAVAEGWALP